jgi:apolipoprotein N-acyltransferase
MSSSADTKQPLAEQLSLIEKVVGAVAMGLVLGLSCASYGVWWLAWCALAPLLVLIRACKSWSEAAAVGFSFGFAYNFLTLFWLYGFHIPGVSAHLFIVASDITALIDVSARALPLAFFGLLLYALPMRAGIFPDYRRPFFPYILSVPVAWIFFEYLSGLTIGMRINDLCYSQAGQLAVIEIARLGGGKLLTFLLVLSNTALAQLFLAWDNLVKPLGQRTDRLLPVTGALIDLMTVSLLVVLCALIGRGSPGSCLNNNVPKVTVLVNQLNEGTSVNIQGQTIAINIAGVNQVLLAPNQLLYSGTRRSYLRDIFSLSNRMLPFIYPAAGSILNNYIASLPNNSSQVADTPWGRIGISTALALPGSSIEKEEVRQGAGLLLCTVDPSCFHSTILDKQILAAAVMAAVENGRYMVLSTNHGICAIINPCGQIVIRSLPGNTGTLADQVQFLYRSTYFSNVNFN